MSPTALLLLQLVVVLAVARACNRLASRMGQPGVVGEMAAGFILGPIVMGALAPKVHAALFSANSLAGLSALSTFGLVLFMFIIGLELRWPDGVRAQIRAATCVGVASVIVMTSPLVSWFSGRARGHPARRATTPSRAPENVDSPHDPGHRPPAGAHRGASR